MDERKNELNNIEMFGRALGYIDAAYGMLNQARDIMKDLELSKPDVMLDVVQAQLSNATEMIRHRSNLAKQKIYWNVDED